MCLSFVSLFLIPNISDSIWYLSLSGLTKDCQEGVACKIGSWPLRLNLDPEKVAR